MSQNIIDVGAAPNDGTGEPLRDAFIAINNNFSQIFSAGPVDSNVRIANNTITTTVLNSNLVIAPSGIGITQVKSSIVPGIDNVYDLGSPSLRFNSIYLGSGELDIVGNLSVGYYYGNGRFLTGVLAAAAPNIVFGNTQVDIPDADANVVFTVRGSQVIQVGNVQTSFFTPFVSNSIISATGNISTSANLNSNGITANTISSGTLSIIGNTTTGNLSVVGTVTSPTISVVGNITGGNLVSVGIVTSQGNVVGANITTSGLVSAQGNVVGANITTSGLVSAQGNVVGANIVTAGLVSAVGNVNAGSFFTSGNINGNNVITINDISVGANLSVGNIATTTNLYVTNVANIGELVIRGNTTLTGNVTLAGNIDAGNIRTTGVVSAAGNVIGANITTSGLVSGGNISTTGLANVGALTVTGNVSIAGNITSNLNVSSNIAGANITTPGLLSATGNIISGANILGNFVSPGANREILFNDNGLINSNSGITFNKVGPTLTLTNASGTIITGYLSSLGGTDLNLTPATSNLVIWGSANPRFSNTYTLGTSSFQWRNIWAGNANIGTLGVSGNLSLGNLEVTSNAVISGDLTVNGNTTFINVTNLNVEDPIIGIGRGANNTPLTTDDGKDRGEQLWYYNGSEKSAFIGYDNSSGNLIAASNVTVTNEIVSVNDYGNIILGNIYSPTVYGNIVTTNIDSADSSLVTVVPDVNFLASVDIDQDLFVDNLIRTQALSATGIVTAEKFVGQIPASSNMIYVAKNGSDTNDGTFNSPLATIKEAMSRATAGTAVQVAPGTYLENNPITIPASVSLMGDNLRNVQILPKNPNSDFFYLKNASYVWGITIRDYLANGFAYDPSTPSQNVFVSPYIQNLTSFTTTGTAVKIDGSLSSAVSTKAMIVGFFTIINRGGKGIHLINGAYSQLVNIYTIACDIGILAESGSFCTLNGSDCSIGNFGLKANGVGTLQTTASTVGYSTQGLFRLSGLSNGRPHVNTVMTIPGDPTYYTIDDIIPIDNATCDVLVQQTYLGNLAPSTTVSFYVRSAIIASAHTFEYVGAGTNPATALPQYGGIPIEANEVIQENGGVVTFTSTDQKGNFKVGAGFIINQAQGTIEGDYFYKALFAQMTPYILALQQ